MPKRAAAPRYHHGDLREALVAAAIAHVAQTGNVELTVRSLAATVGVSHAAAYRHFDGKAALLAEVARRGFASFAAVLSAARAETGQLPAPRLPATLHALATAYVCFAFDEPGLFRVMWDAQIKPFDAHPGLAEAARASLQVLVEALADAGACTVDRGDASGATSTARDAALVVWSAVHGYATLALDDQLTRPFAIADARGSVSILVETLLRGLCGTSATEATGPTEPTEPSAWLTSPKAPTSGARAKPARARRGPAAGDR